MKKSVLGILLVGSVVLCSAPAMASVSTETARALIEESVFWETLGNIPVQLRTAMDTGWKRAAGAADPAALDRLKQAADKAFTAGRARASALKTISNGLDDPTVAALRKWNASPTGKKLLVLEKASSSAGDRANLVSDGQAELNKADDARRAALQGIMEATHVAESAEEISLSTAVAMVRGMAAVAPPPQALPPEDQLRAMLKAQLSGSRQARQAVLYARIAAVYAAASVEELNEYAQFLKSPAGSKMNELKLAAIGELLKEGAEEMGRQLALTPDPGAAGISPN